MNTICIRDNTSLPISDRVQGVVDFGSNKCLIIAHLIRYKRIDPNEEP